MAETLKQQTKKGLYWSFFNQFSSYGMQFCVGIVMARLLTPSDYGITALPAVFMAIASVFQNCGMIGALIRKEEIKEEDLSTTFIYSTITGIIIYAILFFLSPIIADYYETPVLTPLVRISALTFLFGPIGTPQQIILRRKLDFKTPTKISVITMIFSAVVGISMAYNGYGLWALVISSVLSSFLGLVIIVYAVKWYPTTGWSRESFQYLWNYGNKMLLSSLLDTAYNNITPLFVAKYYTPADLGVYNRARNYATLPSQNINGVIQNVTFPVLSKMQNDDETLARNYRKMITVTAFLVFPIMFMLSALARPLIIIMLTEKWESSIILLQLLCFAMMWYPVHSMNLNLLQVKGRTDLFLKLEIIKKILGLIILVITLPMGLTYFCIGGIISSLVSLFINTYYTGKLINVGFLKQMKDLTPILLACTVMYCCIYLLNYFFSNMYIQLFIGGIIGTLVYLSIAFAFKFKEIDEVKYLLKKKS